MHPGFGVRDRSGAIQVSDQIVSRATEEAALDKQESVSEGVVLCIAGGPASLKLAGPAPRRCPVLKPGVARCLDGVLIKTRGWNGRGVQAVAGFWPGQVPAVAREYERGRDRSRSLIHPSSLQCDYGWRSGRWTSQYGSLAPQPTARRKSARQVTGPAVSPNGLQRDRSAVRRCQPHLLGGGRRCARPSRPESSWLDRIPPRREASPIARWLATR
jgi:hypothetical protein